MNQEIDRLVQFDTMAFHFIESMKDLDPLEYERVQRYISSKYGIDLPLTQGE